MKKIIVKFTEQESGVIRTNLSMACLYHHLHAYTAMSLDEFGPPWSYLQTCPPWSTLASVRGNIVDACRVTAADDW